MNRNKLAGAASPYLLQHQYNPVQWWEWSDEAIAEAKRTNRPILLSIGYAACHWCHVMAHESFEDESTAAIMNRLYVNVKVDREERPDIDQIYMAALHAMGQQGGWPLTMFLTPEGEPFWGGTYFPKEAAFGRPSFGQVLEDVSRAYHQAPDRIRNNTAALRDAVTQKDTSESTATIDASTLDELAKRIYSHMDLELGGLQGAPKFPNTPILEFLFRASERSGNPAFQNAALFALRRMCLGGIHDHIGGGFSRYSVDERWHVPHFEKMLYDNAQLLELLALAAQLTGEAIYSNAAESIVAWINREMRIEPGVFAASLDADSEGVEGKYYCWTVEEIEAVLGPRDAEQFCAAFDATSPGNWTEMHTGTQTNVLNQLKINDLSLADSQAMRPLKSQLLAVRLARIPPLCDDKILTDWNALMIGALVRASITMNRPEWLDIASRCFHGIAASMMRMEGNSLRIGHSQRAGKLVWPGMATDYAYMIRAALILHEANAEWRGLPDMPDVASYLDCAIGLANSLAQNHQGKDSGLLSLPAEDATGIIYRTFSTSDDATPNANSVFLHCLFVLAAVTGDHSWMEKAQKLSSKLMPAAFKNPFGHTTFLNAIDTWLRGAEIVITGQGGARLLDTALSLNFLSRIVIDASRAPAAVKNRFAAEPASAAAYICVGARCSLPVDDPRQIAETVANMRRL